MKFTINVPILQLLKTKKWRTLLNGTREIIQMLLAPGSFITTVLIGSLLIFFIAETSFAIVSVFIAVCFMLYASVFSYEVPEDEEDEEPECYE